MTAASLCEPIYTPLSLNSMEAVFFTASS